MRTPYRWAMVVGVVLLPLDCSSTPSEPAEGYSYTQPEETGDGWSTASLDDVGIDEVGIAAAIEGIDRGDYPRVHAVLIAKHGRLVLEEYFRGRIYQGPAHPFGSEIQFDRDRIHQLASVTKSITSTLVGLAIDQGFIEDVHVPIHTLLPRYAGLFDEEERQITIEHLLTMTAGWEWRENTEWGVSANDMYGFNVASDPLAYLLSKKLSASPGEEWVYNGGAVTLLGKVVEEASGLDLEAFSERYLFSPLGVTDFSWPYMRPTLIAAHGDAKLRPRDMAKLGQLFLDGGVWDGSQVLSQSWVQAATQGALEGDYGYLWWGDGSWGGYEVFRSFSARGWGGQWIIVLPELDMVVAFTGGNYESWDPVEAIMVEHILPASGG